MTKTKPELMIASWPDRPVDTGYFDPAATNSSARIHLRHVDLADKWSLSDESRAYSDLGLYVWADIDGTVSIDLRAMDIHSASAKELEQRCKLLKRLDAKATKAGFGFHTFHRDASVYEQLIRCLDAIGIRTAVEYHGINATDTYAPVAIAAKRIADAIDNQLATQRQRRAA